MEELIRVLVVDDHFVVRKGVCALLLDAADFAVVGEAGDGCEAIELAKQKIAEELGIAEITVRTHVSHILGKLDANNRVQAALYALRAGLVSLEDV